MQITNLEMCSQVLPELPTRLHGILPAKAHLWHLCVSTSVLAQSPVESKQDNCIETKKVEIIPVHVQNWSLKDWVFISKLICPEAVMFLNGARVEVLWSPNTRDSWLLSENARQRLKTNDWPRQISVIHVMYFVYDNTLRRDESPYALPKSPETQTLTALSGTKIMLIWGICERN